MAFEPIDVWYSVKIVFGSFPQTDVILHHIAQSLIL